MIGVFCAKATWPVSAMVAIRTVERMLISSGVLFCAFYWPIEVKSGQPESKIEVGIMLWRRRARDMVGEQRPKAGARLEPREPVLGGRMVAPRHVAYIVDRRQVCRRRDIGQREMIPRKPAPALREVGNIIEMIMDIREAGANRRGVGLADPQDPLHQLLADKVVRHLRVELDVEPGDQPPRLRAGERIGADERPLGISLVDILLDGLAFGEHRAVDIDQYRDLARGIERKKFVPAFPDLLQNQVEGQPFLCKNDADLARKGR